MSAPFELLPPLTAESSPPYDRAGSDRGVWLERATIDPREHGIQELLCFTLFCEVLRILPPVAVAGVGVGPARREAGPRFALSDMTFHDLSPFSWNLGPASKPDRPGEPGASIW